MGELQLDALRNQVRGLTGALFVVGIALLYTMETWWLSWRLPLVHLLMYALAGLAAVLVVARQIGFREEDQQEASTRNPWELGREFTELVLQSFLAANLALLVFGILELGDPLLKVARLGLLNVVPLAFGAALANRLLVSAEDSGGGEPVDLGNFVLGGVFVAFPLAPIEETVRIAAHAGWDRLPWLVAGAVVVAHLVLHELEFRGHGARTEDRSRFSQVGTAFVVYAVGVAVATALLAGFGQFRGVPFGTAVQQVVILSFPAALGASAGEVVL
jgi:putative integral membrane protein (TIGR02587 family)